MQTEKEKKAFVLKMTNKIMLEIEQRFNWSKRNDIESKEKIIWLAENIFQLKINFEILKNWRKIIINLCELDERQPPNSQQILNAFKKENEKHKANLIKLPPSTGISTADIYYSKATDREKAIFIERVLEITPFKDFVSQKYIDFIKQTENQKLLKKFNSLRDKSDFDCLNPMDFIKK